MSSVWELFMNSAEMERILGIRVKLQVVPPPGEKDPNSIKNIAVTASTMSTTAPRSGICSINPS
jgi:hypothetical protein